MNKIATYTFSKFSFKFTLPIVVFGLGTILIFLFYIREPANFLLYTMIGNFLITIIPLYFGIVRKVILFNNKIEYHGINSFSEINFSQVNSFGVFTTSTYGGKTAIHPSKINDFKNRGIKYIYLSVHPNPDITSQNSNSFIFFQYRKSAYDILNSKLNLI